jgi:DNA repair protein RadC
VRIELVRDAASDYAEQPIRGAAEVWRLLRQEIAGWDRERFLTLLLDGRHKAIGLEEVSVGTATASLVHPREIFKGIILANAVAFILVHNHPSGDPSPSREDREVTERLKKASELMGIKLLDHIVFGKEGFHSFAEAGEL